MKNSRVIEAELGGFGEVDKDGDVFAPPAPAEVKTKNQLGTINGVFVPCLLNILGAVLFMRIGYSVGYAGELPHRPLRHQHAVRMNVVIVVAVFW